MRLLRAFTDRKKSPLPEPVSEMLLVAGEEVVLTFKRHAAARRFTLRLSRDGRGFVMTMPRRASMMDARAFAPQVASVDGAGAVPPCQNGRSGGWRGRHVPWRRTPHRRHRKARGHVVLDEEAKLIHVPGAPNHMRRRLIDWLKAEAAHDLDVASTKYALAMGTQFRRLNVRDQKSRWGSCSTDGVLNYSWRLVLAPAFVLDYVAPTRWRTSAR